SFRQFQHTFYDPLDPLGTLLIHNTVVGCTMAINRHLAELADPLPSKSPHDWWLSLCAASAGKIASVDHPMTLYRQHATNVIGAQARRSARMKILRSPIGVARSVFKAIGDAAREAELLDRRLSERGTGANKARERVRHFRDAFSSSASTTERLHSLRASDARPTRSLARAVLPAIVVSYPLFKRADE